MNHDTINPLAIPPARKPGELLFAMLMLAFSLAMLAQIGVQTTWLANKNLAAQPRLWPLLGLGTMAIAGALNLWSANRIRRTPGRWKEAFLWFSSLEYVGWYLVYVASVPVAGYLIATLVFCLFLTWRAGYRDTRTYIAAAFFGLCVVLFFKSALNVKIPGGAVYDYLPGAIRNVMLRYF